MALVKRPGLLGILLLALAATLLTLAPADSAWKWPTVMLLLILGFIMLFISAAQRPRTHRFASRSGDGGSDGMTYGSGGAAESSEHHSHGDPHSQSVDSGDGGAGGDGGGGGD